MVLAATLPEKIKNTFDELTAGKEDSAGNEKSFTEKASEYAGRVYGEAKEGLSQNTKSTEKDTENAKEDIKESAEGVKEEAIKTKDAAASSWAKGKAEGEREMQ